MTLKTDGFSVAGGMWKVDIWELLEQDLSAG